MRETFREAPDFSIRAIKYRRDNDLYMPIFVVHDNLLCLPGEYDSEDEVIQDIYNMHSYIGCLGWLDDDWLLEAHNYHEFYKRYILEQTPELPQVLEKKSVSKRVKDFLKSILS